MRIFIKKIKEVSFLLALAGCPLSLYAQEAEPVVQEQPQKGVTVTGSVIDARTGTALPGISVQVPGYSADLTDLGGNFSLNVPSSSTTIIVDGVESGYQNKEVALKGRSSVEISIFPEPFSSFYDVVQLPNNNEKPISKLVGSVKSVPLSGDKWKRSAESPENYLQGKVAGLNVVRKSGEPGAGANIFLRGYNSLYTSNQPLIVVDGMIYDMTEYGESIINNHIANPLNYLDLKDIQNISVIKDATSIYGSKGANGVILITTSRAEELATRIDFSTYAGVNLAPDGIPVLDASEYRTYLSDVLKSGGYSETEINALPFMNDEPGSPGYYSYRSNTDWQKEVFKNSFNQNYYLNVRGGDNIAKYALSLGYMDQGGVVENTDFSRYNTRFNANLNMTPKLKVDANMAFTYGQQNLADQGIAPKTNPVYLSLIKAPFIGPNQISDEGIVSPNLSNLDTLNVGNPRALIENYIGTSKNYRFFGSVKARYEFSDNFSASTQFGINNDKIRENLFIPSKGVLSDTLLNALATNTMASQVQRSFSIYNDTRLGYEESFQNLHNVNANIGLRYLDYRSENDFGYSYNSATDDLRTLGQGPNLLRRAGGDIGSYRWMNLYFGLDYNYLNKYYLSFNVATDGSSRFGKEAKDGITLFDTKFGVFPSIGAGWTLSSEDFMAGVNAVDLLKVRATYSITGNDDIGNYTARQYYVGQNLLGLQGLIRGNIGNPALQWETTTKINAGIDLALFNEKIGMSMDVFKNVTENMLIQQPLPKAAGFGYMLSNSGAMENVGAELSINSRVLNRTNLTWDLGLNIATYKNEVTQLLTEEIVTQFAGANILTRVGEEANLFYGYKTNGIYTSNEAADALGYTTRTPSGTYEKFRGGDVRFEDTFADGIIDAKDMVVIGNPNPDFFGMLSSTIGYGRISLTTDFSFSQGNDIFNYTRAQLESMSGTQNQTKAVLNRWRTSGQNTDMPRASLGDPMGNARFSDRWIEDGSYIRLRTVSLNYNLSIGSNPYLKYASIYATANNLITFTNYKGFDPEFSAAESIFAQGIDLGLAPQFTSVLVGVRLGL